MAKNDVALTPDELFEREFAANAKARWQHNQRVRANNGPKKKKFRRPRTEVRIKGKIALDTWITDED